MEYTKQGRRNRTFIIIWTIAVIGFIYLPVLCDALSSLSKGRYFMFPIKSGDLTGGQRLLTQLRSVS